MADTLEQALLAHTRNKSSFSLAQLKKDFPKDKDTIKKYLFIGLIEPMDIEVPDRLRAHYYKES